MTPWLFLIVAIVNVPAPSGDIFGEAPGDGQRWQFASLAASGTTVAVGVDSKTQMVPGGSGYAYLVPGKVQVWESACDW